MIGTTVRSHKIAFYADIWLCGHAHTTHEVTIGATLVASNPRAGDGPGHVNPEFTESYVLEL